MTPRAKVNVFRLDIPVHPTGPVQSVQGLGCLSDNPQGQGQFRVPPLGQTLGQGLPFQPRGNQIDRRLVDMAP